MKDDECLFTRGLHKSLRTHTCAGVHTEKRIHKCKTQENIQLKTFCLMFFLSNAKDNQFKETDGIIPNHKNCSWPQLMMVNNPNECYTMLMIAILLSAYRPVENVNCYANLSNRDKDRLAKAHIWGMSSLCMLDIYYFVWFSLFISAFHFFFVFHSPILLFLKGSLCKSNRVSPSVRQLQSPAPWSGPSILSPTSWLFKRAKAQQCSFLNTQIHPSTNRGTAVWQKSLSLYLSRSIFPHLGLPHSPSSHYPPSSIDLIIPGYSSLSFSPQLFLIQFISHTHSLSPVLCHHLPFSIRNYFSCPRSSSGTPSHCPVPPLYLCCNSIPIAASAFRLTLSVKWLMPSLGSGPSLLPHTQGHHAEPRGDAVTSDRELKCSGATEGFGEQAVPTHVWGEAGLGGPLVGSTNWYTGVLIMTL